MPFLNILLGDGSDEEKLENARHRLIIRLELETCCERKDAIY